MARKADMARGTRTDAMRHARPRGRTAQAHAAPRWRVADADAWQGHADPCGCPGGATWRVGGCRVKGPWVSGPSYDYWCGNANALRPSRFYTHLFPSFLSCGTMSRLTF